MWRSRSRARSCGHSDNGPGTRRRILDGVPEQYIGAVDMLEHIRANSQRGTLAIVIAEGHLLQQITLVAHETGNARVRASWLARMTPSALLSIPRTMRADRSAEQERELALTASDFQHHGIGINVARHWRMSLLRYTVAGFPETASPKSPMPSQSSLSLCPVRVIWRG